MSQSPFQDAEGLHVGVVEFVSPDEIKVLLDIEAPESVALNAGGARPFPRVNGYVLIPVDDGHLVGQIEWLTVERSAFPKRHGMQDFGLVDLPYPLRKMSLNPLGMLRKSRSEVAEYRFRRGAESFPSIGASVLLPTDVQLRSIVQSGERQLVRVGVSPLADNAGVYIDPDRLFGRHLAVLGNTGSGKSCSVAGLIRWSLESAAALGCAPNARFIILDPNGEYSRAFPALGGVKARVFKASPKSGESALRVPLWFWNSAEWCSFTQASARAQRPLLKRALRDMRAGSTGEDESPEDLSRLSLRRYLTSTLISLQAAVRAGMLKTDETKFGFRLQAIVDDLIAKQGANPECDLSGIIAAIQAVLEKAYNEFEKAGRRIVFYRAFPEAQVDTIAGELKAALALLGGMALQDGPDEDVPVPFDGSDFADHLELLAEQEGVSQYVDFLVARIRTFLADKSVASIVSDPGPMSLDTWVSDYIGSDDASGAQVSIIDLSFVPTEVIHVVTAVVARMVFESLQRYRVLNGQSLPTVLIMEEAHTFIRRYRDDVETQDGAATCCQVFERIAREGRKFGLGLVLSSQRPSELSPTVLSQCNTFLLHRISNDRDQELVQRLVPDNLRGLLRDLPSLPSQNAILMGWATELPVLVKMNDLPKAQQPHSDDPEFWDVWVGKDAAGNACRRTVEWKPITDDWQGETSTGEPVGESSADPSEGPEDHDSSATDDDAGVDG